MPDQGSFDGGAIEEGYFYLLVLFNDVIVCHNVAFGINHEAGALSLGREGIIQISLDFFTFYGDHNIDDRGIYSFIEVAEEEFFGVGLGNQLGGKRGRSWSQSRR